MKRKLLAATSLAVLLGAATAHASSHREAPAIAGEPRLDGTDFYMFRSYETGRQDFVTLIADYIPLQDVYGGPNFFNLDDHAYYDINIDNQGSGFPRMRFRFRFTTTSRDIALMIGGTRVPVPFVNVGAISATNNAAQNVMQTYTLSLVTGDGSTTREVPITGPGGTKVFSRPVDNIGMRSIPDYATYAKSFIYPIAIPGCTTMGRVFVGQRKDPFVVNLSETFDLLNYKHPIGEQYKAAAPDSLADKNVTALEMEVPIACLTAAGDPVVGAWTTSTKVMPNGQVMQVSRLGNPLVNELVIGLRDKDMFNTTLPRDDIGHFGKYVTNPTLPAVIAGFVGGTAPTNFPRSDLVGVFITGIGPDVLPGGLNQPKMLTHPGEEMRLNTAVAAKPAAMQSRLGVIGDSAAGIAMDVAGYPNGRRPGDDVVDISLRVVMGKLCQLSLYCKPSDAPSGNLEYTDGAYLDATHYEDMFPYLQSPLTGSPAIP